MRGEDFLAETAGPKPFDRMNRMDRIPGVRRIQIPDGKRAHMGGNPKRRTHHETHELHEREEGGRGQDRRLLTG